MNPRFFHRVAKLLPYSAKTTNSHPSLAFAYHFEPPLEQDNQLGSLYIVIEVLAKESFASQVIDLIIKTFGEEYYNKKYSDEAENRFEKAITELNMQLSRLNDSHHAKDLDGISAVVAVLNQSELYLTQCGKAHARLYRKSTIIDLADGLNEGSNPKKIFRGIAEGTLNEHDKLLLATPAIAFEFDTKNLNTLVRDNSPATAVGKMNAQLKDDNNASRCAALIVELTDWEQAADQLLDHNPDTARSGKPKTKLDNAKDAALPIVQNFSSKLRVHARRGNHWLRTNFLPNTKRKVKSGWNWLWTNHINPNPKRALIITVGLIVTISLGIILFTSNNYNRKNLVTSYKEAIALTQTAEAQQSLGETESSKRALESAQQKIAYLQKEFTKEQIERAFKGDSDLSASKNSTLSQLTDRLAALEDKINNITRVELNTVADFTTIKDFKPTFISRIDDRLYTIDANTGSLYQINPTNKQYSKVGQNNDLKATVGATVSSSGSTLFILTSKPNMWQYSPGRSLSLVKLSGGEWNTGSALASYIGNLYVLAPKGQQIYRHSPTSIGFSASSSYVKRASPVEPTTTASSMAINGSIIVTDSTRRLQIYTNGIGEETEVADLPSSVNGIRTITLDPASANNDQLLALSSNGLQLLQLNLSTDGINFVRQYAFASTQKTISFALSEDGKTVFTLSDKKILAGQL